MGGDDTNAKPRAHHGAGLIQPQGRDCLPYAQFLAWHRSEMFKQPAREQRAQVGANTGLVSEIGCRALVNNGIQVCPREKEIAMT